jgi:hypothetical protein
MPKQNENVKLTILAKGKIIEGGQKKKFYKNLTLGKTFALVTSNRHTSSDYPPPCHQ